MQCPSGGRGVDEETGRDLRGESRAQGDHEVGPGEYDLGVAPGASSASEVVEQGGDRLPDGEVDAGTDLQPPPAELDAGVKGGLTSSEKSPRRNSTSTKPTPA